MLLMLLFACRSPDSTPQESDSATETGETDTDTGLLWGAEDVLDLYDFEGDNHLLPTKLLVSSIKRQAYSHALNSDTLAQIDLDSRSLLTVHDLPGTGRVELYDGGNALYVTRESPPLQIFDPVEVSFQALVVGLESVSGVLHLSETKTAICGTSPDGSYLIQVHDRSDEHKRLSFEILPDVPRGLLQIDADHLAVIMGNSSGSTTIEIRANADLSLTRSCSSPFGASAFALTPDGDVMLATNRQIGLAPCSETLPSREPALLELGEENMEVILSPTGMIVLDRVGEVNPNWSIARIFDTSAGSLDLSRSFQTGKNSGRGGRDSQTGLIWMNSEGTTETWAMDPKEGSIRAQVPLGLHIESTAASDTKGTVLVSGRLSSLLAVVDFVSGTTQVLNHTLSWPVSPTYFQGRFYVLDQLTGSVHRFDALDFKQGLSLDLGWENLDSLTISHMSLHPERGTLLISQGAADEVIEVDLESFSIKTRVPLGAPLDRDDPGRMEVFPYGDGALAIRSYDGRVAEIDLDNESAKLHEPLAGALQKRSHMQFSSLSQDQSLLYIGPYAVSTDTWLATPALDRDWSFPVHQDAQGDWVGWRESDTSLVRFSAAGEELATVPTEFGSTALPEWIHTPWLNRYIATDMGQGTLNAFSFTE